MRVFDDADSREKWIYGITFAVLIVFLAMGVLVAYAPTDARTSVLA